MIILRYFTINLVGALLLAATVLSIPTNSASNDKFLAENTTSISTADTSPSNSLKVLSNNVFFLPEALLNWGQNPYQTPTLGQSRKDWNSTSGSYSSLSPVNGGVVIMSKWPIKEKHQFIYKTGCGSDWFSNKGFIYVVLDYNGANLHVFGTHMQSDDSHCYPGQAAACRAQAMESWRSFLSDRNIPREELVIFAGDFNIDRNTAEFNSTLTSPHSVSSQERLNKGGRSGASEGDPSNSGSSDPSSVAMDQVSLHAPDDYEGDASTWTGIDNSIAHFSDPKEHNYIDFIFVVENKSPSPVVQSVVQTALKVHSPAFTIWGQVYNDYSDHWPISANIVLKKDPIHQGNTTMA
ncbi:hypothetical protein EMPS_11259 [Entomortierella parvispora]|uniref:sphingomyelin phosphodiesterase n=1 Tax=Entomortierella parvispora TaxID=205924 RepID=A0A9P3HLD5_9FUNG|nr:hypothetical protein EMPS_11259 [Entomortierella parvispora]